MASRPAPLRYKFPKIVRLVPIWDSGRYNAYPFFDMGIAWAFHVRPRAHQTWGEMAQAVRCAIQRHYKESPRRFGTRTVYLQGVRYLEVVRIS